MANDTERNNVLRVRDSKVFLLFNFCGGLVSASVGFSLMMESYWHGFQPEMLILGSILAIVGVFLTYKSSSEAIDKYHSLTNALFAKA